MPPKYHTNKDSSVILSTEMLDNTSWHMPVAVFHRTPNRCYECAVCSDHSSSSSRFHHFLPAHIQNAGQVDYFDSLPLSSSHCFFLFFNWSYTNNYHAMLKIVIYYLLKFALINLQTSVVVIIMRSTGNAYTRKEVPWQNEDWETLTDLYSWNVNLRYGS